MNYAQPNWTARSGCTGILFELPVLGIIDSRLFRKISYFQNSFFWGSGYVGRLSAFESFLSWLGTREYVHVKCVNPAV